MSDPDPGSTVIAFEIFRYDSQSQYVSTTNGAMLLSGCGCAFADGRQNLFINYTYDARPSRDPIC